MHQPTYPNALRLTENRIGCAKNRPQFAFDKGAIDEVALWQRALTQAEIRTVLKGNILSVSPSDKVATTWGDIKGSLCQHSTEVQD